MDIINSDFINSYLDKLSRVLDGYEEVRVVIVDDTIVSKVRCVRGNSIDKAVTMPAIEITREITREGENS